MVEVQRDSFAKMERELAEACRNRDGAARPDGTPDGGAAPGGPTEKASTAQGGWQRTGNSFPDGPDAGGRDAIAGIADALSDAEAAIALRCVPSCEKSLALTRLEEAMLWAASAIVKHGAWEGGEGV